MAEATKDLSKDIQKSLKDSADKKRLSKRKQKIEDILYSKKNLFANMNLEKVEQQNFFQEESEVIKEDPGVKGWLNLSSQRKRKKIPRRNAGSVDPLHILRIDAHTLDVFSVIVQVM